MPTPSEELRRRIVAELNAGVPGAKLGSERELAERYGTSRSSLRQVLAALEEAGLVHRVIGRSGGIFISHVQVQRSLSDLVGVRDVVAVRRPRDKGLLTRRAVRGVERVLDQRA